MRPLTTCLRQYDFEVVHRAGLKHQNADGLGGASYDLIQLMKYWKTCLSCLRCVRACLATASTMIPKPPIDRRVHLRVSRRLNPTPRTGTLQCSTAGRTPPKSQSQVEPHGSDRVNSTDLLMLLNPYPDCMP